MILLSKTREWLEAGRQIGKSVDYHKDGEEYWLTVGIQRWEGVYKLYISNVKMSEVYNEDAHFEEVTRINQFEEIEPVLTSKTFVRLGELTPLKGQKIFNPRFD